jgi:hypothetical protein
MLVMDASGIIKDAKHPHGFGADFNTSAASTPVNVQSVSNAIRSAPLSATPDNNQAPKAISATLKPVWANRPFPMYSERTVGGDVRVSCTAS